MNELALLVAAHPLVHLNAALNALAAVLLVLGYRLIKQGRPQAHGRVMLAAFGVSCLFLMSYLTYHGLEGSVKFTHPGAVRYMYLLILLTHVVLAAAVPWLAVVTIWLALRGTGVWGGALTEAERATQRARHRRWARWTFPIWMYVSVTGVIVYLMLYHLWPPAGI